MSVFEKFVGANSLPVCSGRIRRGVVIFAALFLAATSLLSPLSAESLLDNGPSSMLIAYKAAVKDRPAFRDYLGEHYTKRLNQLRDDGVLDSYRIFYSWYAQSHDWDAMIELQFAGSDAVEVWNEIVKREPAGLDAAGLKLATPISTISADLDSGARAPGSADNGDAAYLVIPYVFNSTSEYRDYSRAYVLPQFDGWIKEGALSGYEVMINRYPAGEPWDSLIILQYQDFKSLGQRDRVKEKVRAELRNNAEWIDFHQRKGSIRTEIGVGIAELISYSN